jgi:hypothetical protein
MACSRASFTFYLLGEQKNILPVVLYGNETTRHLWGRTQAEGVLEEGAEEKVWT